MICSANFLADSCMETVGFKDKFSAKLSAKMINFADKVWDRPMSMILKCFS